MNINNLNNDLITFYEGTEFETKISIRDIAIGCLNKGKLRRSKPFKKTHEALTSDGKYRVCSDPKGEMINYVWRMLAFYLIAEKPYSCMPMTAHMDLPYFKKDGSKVDINECKKLDVVIDAVLHTIPVHELKGVIRWGKALGRIS